MKRGIILLASAVWMSAVSFAPAATVLHITFDNAPLGTAPVPYVGYTGDTVPGGAAVNTSDPTGPGDPDLASAGTIVDTATAGSGFAGTAQGGRCLQLGGANGYYVALPAGLNNYRVTVKVAFTTYPGPSAEFAITNVISMFFNGAYNEAWELRGLGNFGAPANEMVLMHDNDSAGGDTNLDLGNFVPVTNRWYTMSVEYNSSGDVLKAIIDASTTTVNPGFGADTFSRFTFGYWPNDANSNRDVVGLIDEVIVDDLTAGVSDWTLY